MHTFSVESVLHGFELRITNIKITDLKDKILLLLQLGDRDISRLASLHSSLHLMSPLAHAKIFIRKLRILQIGDKFGWVE